MRKFILIIICLFSLNIFSQTTTEGIAYLKNGNVIKGKTKEINGHGTKNESADSINVSKIFFKCSPDINEVQFKKNGVFINDSITKKVFKSKNILSFEILKDGQIIMNNENIQNEDIKRKVLIFLENNGDETCDYCQGKLNPSSSSNPNKAYISIKKTFDYSWNLVQKNLYKKISEAYNSLWTREYNKENSTLLKISEFLNLDCETKNRISKKYFPINIIYVKNNILKTLSPPPPPLAPEVIEIIKN